MDQLFRIFRISEAEVEKINRTDPPHHHTYEELIIGREGRFEHFIDFKSYTLEAPFVSFVTKGKVHQAKPEAVDGKCDIWVIRFKSEFIPEITFQLYSFYHDHANLKLKQGSCFERLITLCKLMHDEMQQESPDLGVVKQLLSALFTMVESERRKLDSGASASVSTQSITFKNFLAILEENFRRPEGVEYYAEKLFMSARNLNNICQSILQQSVSEIIETRKLIEAKNLLLSTDKSVSEIGFELGYNEKSYFTTVFKKKSGQTPTEFREEMRRLTMG